MFLPAVPGSMDSNKTETSFTGCKKYAECQLVPGNLKWKPWSLLTKAQQNQLSKIGCYRATRPGWDWDLNAFPARTNAKDGGRWIGNPFGVRNAHLGGISKNLATKEVSQHRDLSPCPIGGCVTPEMQRDYQSRLHAALPEVTVPAVNWKAFEACPFYFRFSGPAQHSAVPNSQRFSQCYLTMPQVLEWLKTQKIVVATPIIRTLQGNEAGSFWYSFYSGFAFLQLPSRAPTALGVMDKTLPLRWHATAVARLKTAKTFDEPPIQRVFECAETGMLLAAWERHERIVSVSE
jgi:hypothetical protein